MSKELSKECSSYLAKHAAKYPANEWGSLEQWISHLYIAVEDFSKGDLRASLYQLNDIAWPDDATKYAIEFIQYHLDS